MATIDQTDSYDEVEFPDGTVAHRVLPLCQTPQQFTDQVAKRVKDTASALDDGSPRSSTASTPMPTITRCPPDCRGALNLSEVGMFGHSLGGATAAAAMFADPRIKAGINMDGQRHVWAGLTARAGPAIHAAESRGSQPGHRPVVGPVLDASTGWKRDFQLQGSQHLSVYRRRGDLPEHGTADGPHPAPLADTIGTINPARSIALDSTYVDSFFYTSTSGTMRSICSMARRRSSRKLCRARSHPPWQAWPLCQDRRPGTGVTLYFPGIRPPCQFTVGAGIPAGALPGGGG